MQHLHALDHIINITINDDFTFCKLKYNKDDDIYTIVDIIDDHIAGYPCIRNFSNELLRYEIIKDGVLQDLYDRYHNDDNIDYSIDGHVTISEIRETFIQHLTDTIIIHTPILNYGFKIIVDEGINLSIKCTSITLNDVYDDIIPYHLLFVIGGKYLLSDFKHVVPYCTKIEVKKATR